MKFNPRLKADVAKYKGYVILVEGKKDIEALNKLGFEKVYAIHQTGVSLRERVEEIANLVGKRDKVCILTDFDKKGKQLYLMLKSELQALGIKMDSSLRGILIKAGVSHIEGFYEFMKKIDKI